MGTFNELSIKLQYAGYSPYSESSTVYRCVFKTKEARLILQSGIYIFWPIFRKARPSEVLVKLFIFPTVKSALLLLCYIFTYFWLDPLLGSGPSFFVGWSLLQKLNVFLKQLFLVVGFWNLVENLLFTATFPSCSHVDSVNWIFVLIF